jgi:hypothetical protein
MTPQLAVEVRADAALRCFLLARWGAPARERFAEVWARDAAEAARALPGARVLPMRPDLALAVTGDAEWLVLEADDAMPSQAALWAGFHARERAVFLSGWFRLRCA